MHETMVAESLFAAIKAEAEKHNARAVSARLTCGKLYCINEDVLSFAFDAISRDSLCEGLKLTVEHLPLRAHCRTCDKDFDVDLDAPRCPDCQGDDFALLPDAPLVLEEIEFETE